MSDKSKIEWTDATWNPVTGCSKVSAGCTHCYAEALDHSFNTIILKHWKLDKPLRWKILLPLKRRIKRNTEAAVDRESLK